MSPLRKRSTRLLAVILTAAALTIVLVSGMALSQTAPASPTHSPTYAIEDLGTLGGSESVANDVNNSAQVVGISDTSSGERHAFLYSGGQMHDLGTLSGKTSSVAYGINDSGQISGYSSHNSEGTRAFLYSGGTMQEIGTLPNWTESIALDINKTGQIAGYLKVFNDRRAFLYSGGSWLDLGTLGGTESDAWAVNDSGQVVGSSYTGLGDTAPFHAFLYSGGQMHDLGTLPAHTHSVAFGINGPGQVVGYSAGGGSTARAFLYSGGQMHDLGTLPDYAVSVAWAVNDSGQVVGDAGKPYGPDHAFLYSGGQMHDLNDLIPSSSGWVLERATAINASGQIVGFGFKNGQRRAFLATPDTTPPRISGVPDDMNVTATSSEGATVTYDVPTAEDLVDGSVPVNCSAPQRRLTNNGAADGDPDWGPLTEANPPALSRENGRIVFHSNWNPQENTNPEGDLEIFTMNPDGSAIKQLTNNGASDSNPAFSPDGKSVVFATNRDGNAEIYKMNADGSSQTRLTNNGASDVYPAISPDGKSVFFATNRDGNYEIYKMSADGLGTPTNLTSNPAYDADTAVSSDGKIAFVSFRDGNFEIYTMNADGSDQRNRTNNPKWDSYPNFSPDGKQIAFHSNRDGNFEVYKMNSDGSGQVNLTNSSASERAPAFSPDGKKIAFESNRDGDGGPAEIYAMNAGGSNSGSATFPLGTTTVSCGATDAAGNQATVSFQVTVEYAFGSGSGGSFGEPVRDTELNRLAAGASVPVKFGLGGDYGLNIFAEDYPKSRRIDCPGKPTDVVEETSTLSKSGLTYDATSGRYTYVWKTDRTWKGTCRELNLRLADGSDHLVQFQFT